jgi:hypothetical protein
MPLISETQTAPAQKTPQEAAMAAINRLAADGISGKPKPSNPGELAAAGGDASKSSTRKWTPEEQQVSRHILERFQAPKGLLAEPSDETIEWGLTLSKMQDGMSAKTKRLEAELAELKASLAERESTDRKSEVSGKDTALAEATDLLTKAVEDGDPKKVGPALEKLAAALKHSAPPPPHKPGPAERAEVRGLLDMSARKEIEAEWPALRNSAILAEVKEIADTLKGARYDDITDPVERRVKQLRDASMIVLGPPEKDAASNQTPARSPGSSAPRPGGRSEATPANPSPMEAAQAILSQHGLR